MLLRRFYISLFIALVIVTCLLSHLISPGVVHGLNISSNPLSVTSRTYSEHFPDYIDLKASVTDTAGSINQASIVLSFRAGGELETHSVELSKTGDRKSVVEGKSGEV